MKISVCMATYNGEKYVKEQLDSILTQLQPTDEIIISDDGSSDGTLMIIESFNDSRIKLINNNFRKGITGNFENALNHVTGEHIFLSDQDDVWLPNKIALNIEALKYNDLVVSNCNVVDENKNVITYSYFKLANSGKGFLKNFYRSSYLGCCLAFNRKVLEKVLPIPSSLPLFHDWWIGFIADTNYRVEFIETPCMLYRRHDSNVSPTTSKSKRPLYKKFFDRFQLLYLGLSRLIRINDI